MSSLPKPASSLFILFLTFHLVSSYIFTGFQIRELDGTGTDFTNDAASWAATVKATANVYSTCNSVYLIGGSGVLGASTGSSKNQYLYRSYTSLPDHTMIRFSFTLYALDTWDANEGFRLGFDDKVVDGWHSSSGIFPSHICGNTYNDLLNIRIFGVVVHSATSLLFKVISDFDEPPSNEAFGFRDLNFIFDKNPVITEYQCARASVTVPKQCTCTEGSYYNGAICTTCDNTCASCYGSGSNQCYTCKKGGFGWDGYDCITCHSYCYDCFGPSNSQCNACNSGYAYYAPTSSCYFDCPFPLTKTASGSAYTCTTPCGATDFIYWDKSCSSTCASPLVQQYILSNTIKLCIYPCSAGEYLYWDGTCQPNCGYPLATTITNGKKFCTYKCTAAQYLDWNNACVATCNYPLVRKVIQGKNICASPCQAPGEHVYWDQECSTSCALPLKIRTTTAGIKYCDYPCTLGSDYLYWNGSCISTCSLPLKIRVEHGKQFCDYPGNTANYLYWDGTSSASCPSPPLIQRTEGTSPVLKFCSYGCNDWEYLYWNGTCGLDCPFPLKIRIQNGKQFCDYPCLTDILFWNGSCLTPCNSPLIPKTEGAKQFCDFPAGNTSKFLYWDGSFSSVCPAPLIQRIEGSPLIRKFCDFKCNPLEYLYFNSQCKTSCDSPHLARSQNGKLFCDFACGSRYLFHNGTCTDTCPFPYIKRVDGQGHYCDHPCTDKTYFYCWDSVCRSTCTSPLTQSTVEGLKWCIYPCSSNQFLANNKACLDSCDAPLITTTTNNLKYCSNPCTSNQYLFWVGTCLSSCDLPLRKGTSELGNTCGLPCATPEEYYYEATGECKTECNVYSTAVKGLYLKCMPDQNDYSTFFDVVLEAPQTASLSLVTITTLTTHIKYLDLNLPSRIERLATGQGRSILSLRFGGAMSEDMRADFPVYDIPNIFKKRGLHSNFMVNFWAEMTSWLIVMGAIVIMAMFAGICRNRDWQAGQELCEKVLTILKWNVLLILICTSLGNIILFASLEVRTIHLGSSITTLSGELCLIVVSVGIMAVIGAGLLGMRYHTVKETGPPHKITEFLAGWSGYQVLYKGLRDNNRFNSAFYLIYLSRIIICGLITAFLFFSPFFQAILYMIISLLMTGYIAITRPVSSKINLIQLLLTEIFTLIVNVGLFAIAVLERTNNQNSSIGVMFADIIVGSNSCINILFIVILAIKLIEGAKSVCIYQGGQRKRDASAWIHLLALVPPQVGMGFEEISVNETAQARSKPRQESIKGEVEEKDQTLGTEVSLMTSKRRFLKKRSSRISPEPVSQVGLSMQSRDRLDTWDEKESRMDSAFNITSKDDEIIVPKEEGHVETSRFGLEPIENRPAGLAQLDSGLLMRMEKRLREDYSENDNELSALE